MKMPASWMALIAVSFITLKADEGADVPLATLLTQVGSGWGPGTVEQPKLPPSTTDGEGKDGQVVVKWDGGGDGGNGGNGGNGIAAQTLVAVDWGPSKTKTKPNPPADSDHLTSTQDVVKWGDSGSGGGGVSGDGSGGTKTEPQSLVQVDWGPKKSTKPKPDDNTKLSATGWGKTKDKTKGNGKSAVLEVLVPDNVLSGGVADFLWGDRVVWFPAYVMPTTQTLAAVVRLIWQETNSTRYSKMHI